MPRIKECPACGKEMEYQQDEPDVGIVGGWYCHECQHVEDEDYGDEEYFNRRDPRD